MHARHESGKLGYIRYRALTSGPGVQAVLDAEVKIS